MIQDLSPLVGFVPSQIPSQLKGLPCDVWQKIMGQFLSVGDCASLSSTCVELRRMTFHSTERTMSIWTKLFRRDCPVLFSVLERELAARGPRVNPIAAHRIWSQLYHTRQRGMYQFLKRLKGNLFDRVTCLTLLNTGYIAAGLGDGRVQVWHIDGTSVLRFNACPDGESSPIHCIAPLPNGRIATSWQRSQRIHVWRPDGILEQSLTGHEHSVLSLTTLSSGRLASSSNDHTIRLWSLQGNNHQPLVGHTGPVNAVIALDDGHLVSASDDGSIRIWQDPYGTSVVFRQHQCEVVALQNMLNGGFVYKLSAESSLYVVLNPSLEPQVWKTNKGIENFSFLGSGGFVFSDGFLESLHIWPRIQCVPTVVSEEGVSSFLTLPEGQLVFARYGSPSLQVYGDPPGDLLDRAIVRAQMSRMEFSERAVAAHASRVSWRLVAAISALVLGVIMSSYSKLR